MSTWFWVDNPLPIPDRGHRAFGVADEHAAITVARVLEETSDLREKFTFDPGPTHQTLMSDGYTVIMRLDSELRDAGMTGNAISRAVESPLLAARAAAKMLGEAGYTAEVLPQEGMGHTADGYPRLVVVRSNAFDHWELVYRRHVLAMGGMPEKRSILGD